MAVDKIIPRFLNLDKDERLLAEDEMTDALNVTLSHSNGQDESVIKNIKGFDVVDSSNNSNIFNPNLSYSAIGSVSDHQNGDVYWFVFGSGNDHLILKQDLSENTLEVVYRGEWLSFAASNFIKGDVITLNIAEEKEPQTILYFTDDKNEPRKINVTRALGTDYYEFINDEERDFSWSSVRASQNKAPTSVFVTDPNYPSNNFLQNPFQFALQYIYKDGEESAIGVYSKIAVCPVDLTYGLPYFSDVIAPNSFNVCEIRLNLKENIYDLKRVRLIARRGNSGEFFTIDEFDPYVDKTLALGASSDTIYDAGSQTYTFRNDVVGTVIDSNTVNKQYDNVPYRARTQAIAANRLVYANYSEGRENFDIEEKRNSLPDLQRPGGVSLSVDYNDISEGVDFLDSSAVFSDEITEAATFNSSDSNYDGSLKIRIDLPDLLSQSTLPAGTTTKVSFKFGPQADRVLPDPNSDDEQFVSGLFGYGFLADYEFHDFEQAYLNLSDLNEAKTVSVTNINPYDVNHSELANQLINKFASEEVELTYNLGSNQANSIYSVIDTEFDDTYMTDGVVDVWGELKVKYRFDTATESSGVIDLHARISSVSFQDANARAANEATPIAINYAFHPSTANPSNLTLDSDEPTEQTWENLTGPNTPHYLSEEFASFLGSNRVGSFKAGSHHKFGIVYYDKYNRSGFVNDIGSVYVKWPGERSSSEYGSASVNISLTDQNGRQVAPQWADRYQIVYSGAVDIDDYVQYVVGGGFPAVFTEAALELGLGATDGGFINQDYINVTAEPSDGHPDFVKCQLYVNIDTLDLYKTDKQVLRDYSFTKGDKLRVVSYEVAENSGADVTYTTNYPLASDGSIIEFDVVDYVTITDGSAEQQYLTSSSAESNQERFIGNFLVLEHPDITGGAQYDDNGTIKPVKYEGFDFFSVARSKVPNTVSQADSYRYRAPGASNADNTISDVFGKNYWGQRCVVEIYTPSKKNEAEVFYEIGVGEDLNITSSYTQDIAQATYGGDGSSQFSLSIDSGDVTFRPVPMRGPVGYSPTVWNWNTENLDKSEQWIYFVRKIENKNLSDYYDSDFWDKGRPHAKFLGASENRIGNGFIYSDAYTQGSENLSLSSFNPSLANFYYLEAKFGNVGFINAYNEDLVAIQSNKLSLVPINKNIIEYAGGDANVTVSTDVFSNARYSSGDFGCGENGESVLMTDNEVAFYDPNRHKAILFSGGQLTPISDEGASSFFSDSFEGNASSFITGFDPDSNILYFTGDQTIGYNLSAGRWQSRYSFVPTYYAFVDDVMCAFYDNGNTGHVWTHDNDITRNSVFGQASTSYVEVVSKLSPSRVKTYNALSYEGDGISSSADYSGRWRVDASAITTNLGTNTGSISEQDFVFREGTMYASMPRTTAGVAYYEGNIMMLGDLDYQSDGSTLANAIYLSNRNLSRLAIPFNENLTINSTNGTFTNVKVKSINKNKIIFDLDGAENTTTSTAATVGNELNPAGDPDGAQIEFDAAINGDVIRGNWAKIKLTTGSAIKTQLYCINAHISDSKYHHALGDQ